MSFLSRLLDLVRSRRKNPDTSELDISQREGILAGASLCQNLERNLQQISQFTGDSADVVIRRFSAYPGKVGCALVFVDGLASKEIIQSALRSLTIEPLKTSSPPSKRGSSVGSIRQNLLVNHEIREATEMKDLLHSLSSGDIAILVEGSSTALLLGAREWEMRAVDEPDAETSIRGSRDGFVESLRVNTSLLRRRIKTPHFWVERMTIGSLTQTNVEMVYIKGLAGEELLAEVRDRLGRIDTDGILESGYIEEFIRDAPFTIIPTVLRTERPDRTAGALLEGQVAIITDGTPFALLVPCTFISFIQAPDDYSEIFPIGSLLRFIRFVSLLVAVFLPGIYVAVVNFHPELLPPTLLLRIAATREGVPFPVVVEMLLMESLFELLREAGIRLPAAIGPAISIVGALVLGQAAIQAGIVSPPVVIVVALTAIASFSTPAFSLAIAARMLRFIVILLGAVFGLFGIQFGALLIMIHLCSLRSFGVPFFSPYAPFIWRDMKDSVVRWIRPALDTRPKLIGFREPVRQKSGQIPSPEGGKDPDRMDSR